jgi:ADP-ribose pyrophosphatase YjhB (NUDIX family)
MTELLHRIKIFVYRMHGDRPDYLLLRGSGYEGCWGPIQGPIGFGEKLESAIRREVMDDVGITRPLDLIDLQMPGRWLVGDEEVIEWSFGFRTPAEQPELRLAQRWAEFRWADFSNAYPSLELDMDRAAILRLHALLHAA